MLKKLFLSLVVLLAVFSFAACGSKEKEAKGYGIVHKDYVGVATMKVKDGEVTALSFEEYYLPYSWAAIEKPAGDTLPADVLEVGTKYYAKYIKIGDQLLTGEVRKDDLVIDGVTYSNEKVRYSNEEIGDLYLWLKGNEANCKWYVEQLEADAAYIAKQDGSKATYTVTGNAKGGFAKSTTGYWPADSGKGLGWAKNMEEIADILIGTKMDATKDELVKGTDNFWYVKGAVSGATVTDFKDYYEVARRAYVTATK